EQVERISHHVDEARGLEAEPRVNFAMRKMPAVGLQYGGRDIADVRPDAADYAGATLLRDQLVDIEIALREAVPFARFANDGLHPCVSGLGIGSDPYRHFGHRGARNPVLDIQF